MTEVLFMVFSLESFEYHTVIAISTLLLLVRGTVAPCQVGHTKSLFPRAHVHSGGSQMFPGQLGDIIPCSGSVLEPPTTGTIPKQLPWELTRWYPYKMPKASVLYLPDPNELQQYFNLPSDLWTTPSFTESESGNTAPKAHFGHLYSQPCSFMHYLRLKNIGEDRLIDCINCKPRARADP